MIQVKRAVVIRWNFEIKKPKWGAYDFNETKGYGAIKDVEINTRVR